MPKFTNISMNAEAQEKFPFDITLFYHCSRSTNTAMLTIENCFLDWVNLCEIAIQVEPYQITVKII